MGRGAGNFYQEDGSVLLGTVTDFTVLHDSVIKNVLRNVVRAATVLVDGFPDERSVGDIQFLGERFRSHSYFGPHVIVCGKKRYVRVHVGILKKTAHTCTVVVQQFEIRPPGVFLVVVTAVSDPSRESRLGGIVIESVPYGMGDSGFCGHIGPDFDKLEGCGEYLVGIGHFLAADKTLSCKVSGGRHVLVNHCVSASATVILIAHFLPYAVSQVVRGP